MYARECALVLTAHPLSLAHINIRPGAIVAPKLIVVVCAWLCVRARLSTDARAPKTKGGIPVCVGGGLYRCKSTKN